MNFWRVLEAMRGGAVDPCHAACYHGGGKGEAPPAPDYKGAAEAQAGASEANTAQSAWANRPTINTPWGSQTWKTSSAVDPSTGRPVTAWESDITLSPEQQAAQEAQTKITQGRSEAANTLLDQATGAFETPFDWEGLPETPGSVSDAQRSAYDTMSASLEPGRERARSSLDTKLANMGLSSGSEAFKRAQGGLGEQFAQQDKQLLAQAMGEGRSDITAQQGMRSAAIAEQAQKRGMTLNELNALLTGQQVNMPQMPGFQQSGTAQAPNYTGAANAAGNYGMQASQMGGTDWGSIIGTGVVAAAAMY